MALLSGFSVYPAAEKVYCDLLALSTDRKLWRIFQLRASQFYIGPYIMPEPFDLANHPVIGASWYEATSCRWLTAQLALSGWEVRLRSGSEWEKGRVAVCCCWMQRYRSRYQLSNTTNPFQPKSAVVLPACLLYP